MIDFMILVYHLFSSSFTLVGSEVLGVVHGRLRLSLTYFLPGARQLLFPDSVESTYQAIPASSRTRTIVSPDVVGLIDVLFLIDFSVTFFLSSSPPEALLSALLLLLVR